MNGMVLSWNVDLYFYFPISTYPSLNRARDERDSVFCLSLQFRCHVIIAEVLILCDSFIEKVRQLIILYRRIFLVFDEFFHIKLRVFVLELLCQPCYKSTGVHLLQRDRSLRRGHGRSHWRPDRMHNPPSRV